MARLARIVIPDAPHHVTQRGNGRQQTVFSGADYALYRDLLGRACRATGRRGSCLMRDAQSRPSDPGAVGA